MNVNLRALCLEDIDSEYLKWYENSDKYLKFYTGSQREFCLKDVVDDFQAGVESKKWFYFLIETSEGERAGNIKIGPIDNKNLTSDLVCFIGERKFSGHGLASKAIKQATELAFSKYGIRRLHGGMYADHKASIGAYLKAGWLEEAVMKGYYWVDGKPMDRICVSCLNPKYFEIIEND
jgi:ribosomal-protein-alanine N-acetyltransferase